MRWRKGRRPSPARRSIARRVAPKAGRPRSRTWFPRITIIGASGHEPADRHRRGGDRGHRADRGAQDRVWADRARAGPRGRGGGLFRRGTADREGKRSEARREGKEDVRNGRYGVSRHHKKKK